ncbi:peptide chain release factor [Phellopilus nigrolimitatus]|nr:peptide chain release factor [Phellopilus nigrolimitatus]
MLFSTLRVLSRRRILVQTARWASTTAPPTAAALQSSIRDAFADIRNALSLVNQGERLKTADAQAKELVKELEDADIWTKDYNTASRKQQQLSHLQKQTSLLHDIQTSFESLSELASLADSSGDSELYDELFPELVSLKKRADELTKTLLLSEPADASGAYIEVKAGSGGTEACDWAGILSRMYTRWAQAHDFPVTLVDETLGEVAGIRHRMLRVDGAYAYGYAQFETGIHRLVRMSPFDAAGQRHTSFASVQVSPYFGEEDEVDEKGGGGGKSGGAKSLVEINPSDLKITTMRSSGAGGQHVNKTESAVRITHIPSGLVVACQQERSQARNRTVAISLLKSRLFDMERLKKARAKNASYTNLPEISWGSQIRSYTLQPYQLIKDVRTGYEVGTGGVQSVLEGELDGFMEAGLRHFRATSSS